MSSRSGSERAPSRRRRWLGLLGLAPLLACGLLPDDAAAIEAYSSRLVADSGAGLTVRGCEMSPPASRLGQCLASGGRAAAEAFGAHFSLTPIQGESLDEWRLSGNSACVASGWVGAHPTATLLEVPEPSPLPSSGTNAHLRRVWIDASEACFDLQFPYG